MNQDKRICPTCGKKITGRGKYCNRECYTIFLRNNAKIKDKKFCTVCGNEILGQGFQFCGPKCYQLTRRGVKRPEHGEKVRKALTGVKHTKQRCENISKAKRQDPITKKEWIKLRKTKELYPWVTNLQVFIEKAGLDRRLKKGLSGEVYDFLRDGKDNTFFNIKIQKWDISKINSFKVDILEIPWDKMLIKYDMTRKEFHSLRRYFNLDYKYKHHFIRNSKPEQIIEGVLLSKSVSFKREKYISKRRWRVDFIIEDKYIIEVNGDYWHTNPRVYSKDVKLTDVQISNKANDLRKKDYILDNGYKLFYIWEMDIYHKIEKIDKFLDYFIKGDYIENFFDSEFV